MTAIPMHDEHDHHHEHDHEHHDNEHHHDHEAGSTAAQLWGKALLLIGLGVYFVYNIASGNILNYVNARFAWLSYVAAALFLLIGGFSAWHLLQDHHHAGHDHDHAHDHDGHTHEPVSWKVLALLAVPLVLGTLIPSKPLGAEAVSGSVSLSSSATLGASQPFNVAPEKRNVLDWLRAFNNADPKSFDGQPADVIGFVYTEPGFDPNTFMVARFAISCCVADATAIGLPVYWDKAADLPQGQWIKVKGGFSVGTFRGDQVAILQASEIAQVEQPEHPYLYP
jgi:uncharacterized repeat protein (TIGR03943 family)